MLWLATGEEKKTRARWKVAGACSSSLCVLVFISPLIEFPLFKQTIEYYAWSLGTSDMHALHTVFATIETLSLERKQYLQEPNKDVVSQ